MGSMRQAGITDDASSLHDTVRGNTDTKASVEYIDDQGINAQGIGLKGASTQPCSISARHDLAANGYPANSLYARVKAIFSRRGIRLGWRRAASGIPWDSANSGTRCATAVRLRAAARLGWTRRLPTCGIGTA
jgi:hypothetical protein